MTSSRRTTPCASRCPPTGRGSAAPPSASRPRRPCRRRPARRRRAAPWPRARASNAPTDSAAVMAPTRPRSSQGSRCQSRRDGLLGGRRAASYRPDSRRAGRNPVVARRAAPRAGGRAAPGRRSVLPVLDRQSGLARGDHRPGRALLIRAWPNDRRLAVHDRADGNPWPGHEQRLEHHQADEPVAVQHGDGRHRVEPRPRRAWPGPRRPSRPPGRRAPAQSASSSGGSGVGTVRSSAVAMVSPMSCGPGSQCETGAADPCEVPSPCSEED